MRAAEAAERTLATLESHSGGLTMRRLLQLAELTPGQYRSGYNWTLDNLGEPIWVKNYIGREWVYRLADDALSNAEDWRRTIRTQVTRARREHSKIYAIAAEHPTIGNRQSELMARTRLEQLRLEKERLEGGE